MALILNIETATTMCSVSLAKDGVLLSCKELDSGYSHAENLTLFIQDVMKEAQKSLSSIDAVSVSKGPGSYTGLRIGVSTAKGLCYSLNKPLIAVDTLQHLSLSVSEENRKEMLYCPMIDARRMEVYCGMYDVDNNEVLSVSAEIINQNSFEDILTTKQIAFFGNGADKCKSIFENNQNSLFIEGKDLSSKSMITLSENAFKQSEFEDVAYFEPFYLKDFMMNKPKL